MARWSPERRAGVILAGFALSEGAWLVVNFRVSPARFLRYSGLLGVSASAQGWALASFTAAAFVAGACRLPSVRANLVRLSWLKALAVVMAIAAGFCEEVIFRKFLMDALAHNGVGVVLQILASGLTFGLVHGIWGAFRGSLRAAVGATTATGLLGLALATSYIVSYRVLAPCILAHVIINLLAEPGLVLAAVRGEMGSPA